ncbi:MAG TPA: acyl-CoA dehydrogenase family protein [Xanthobacteraceae bacterium]|nr:acyl-CoA dehydrogenase family protein [Xanthobacteraceae bacterium]
MAAARPAARPDLAELLSRARKIAGVVRERAQQTEIDRRVSDDVIEEMQRAELFCLLQPQAYGGFEYDFEVFAQIVAVIAGGCGSSGWVYGLLASHQWLTACLPVPAQDEFWHDRRALAAGTYAPTGRGVAADGGYRLSGKWGFCSGCDNADWLYLGGMIEDAQGTKPGFFLVRTAECTIEDNWHTMGLSGTGSKNIIAENVFVPAYRTVSFAELAEGAGPGTRVHANPLYRQSFLAVLPVTIVAPVLGMAEAALADFLAMAKGRITRGAVAGGNRAMAELANVQARAAEASACIDAARLLMFRDLAEARATAARGEPLGVDLRLRNRRDQAFCVRLLTQAIDALFLATGGQGLFLDLPLQRIWRDAHAAASHISLNWDSTGTMYGQHLLGLEPRGQY